MKKEEYIKLADAQKELCEIETIQLDNENYEKWNNATMIIANLLKHPKQKTITKKQVIAYLKRKARENYKRGNIYTFQYINNCVLTLEDMPN